MLNFVAVFATLIGLALAVPSSSTRSLTQAAQDDLIVDLPGLDFPTNYQQFSGYLDGGNGSLLHYWFIESQTTPASDPLLLWLNGGPGCSSLDGLLTELGPFSVQDDGATLLENPYTWNTFANILYLESPACVGFSYNTLGDCSSSDDSTAHTNYNALQDFFAKFPEYLPNDFFVTGESYAGIYVPTLTERIVDNMDSFPLNLQGFAVGNALLGESINDDSLVFYANYHGLVGPNLWDIVVQECCESGVASQDTCQFSTSSSPACRLRFSEVMNIVYNSGLNVYNLYFDCEESSSAGQHGFSRYHADKLNMFRSILSESDKRRVRSDPPCLNYATTDAWLNTPAVKEALHIAPDLPDWTICSDRVGILYDRQYSNMTAQFKRLQQAGVRGLVYNGDVDMACNFIGNEWFVEDLEFVETEARRIWRTDGQVRGFVKGFELLDMLTVLGSGHMVPEDKPEPSLAMIKAFVMNEPYPS